MLFFLTTVNGISAAAGATIFLVVRWINVVWDPWVGATVDKSHPKGGKYLPYGADVKIMDRFFRHREVPDSENFSKPGFQLKTA